MDTDEKSKPDQIIFFKELIEKIVSYGGEDNAFEPLAEICGAFSMDAGFIYLKDPLKGTAFYKKFQTGSADELADAIELPLCRGLEGHISADCTCAEPHPGASVEAYLAKFWGASRLAVLPVFEKGRIVGFVGVLSRNSIGVESEAEKDSLILALALIVGNARAEYYKRQQNYARDSLAKAIDNTGVDIYVTDFYTDEILYVNRSMALPYGGVEAMIGKKCYLTLYENRRAECEFCPKYKLIDENGNPTKLYSWDYQRPFDGAWFRVFSAAFKWEEDRLAHIITSTNITENKRNEFLVEKMALFDALTNIPNRRSFERIFQRLVDKAISGDSPGYVLFIDLDNFKHINDAFGHEKGDELLICVARYLDGFSGAHQQVYRYGGDEFIILVEDQDREAVGDLVDSFLTRFAEPWDLGGLEYFCTASIGAASFPSDGVTYDVLLNAADKAMYEAKKQGKSMAVFSQGGAERRPEAMEFEFALRRAVLDGCGEFEVLFHPIVDIHTGRWAGVEALARWNSQVYGTVGPDRFIPVCEKLGLIFDIEKWLFASAIGEVASWTPEPVDLFLSFNVSALEFCGDGFADYLLSVADEKGYPHRRLMLEIAESPRDLNLKIADIKNRLDCLRGQGVAVALDGFGIGYDSLERIQELPVDFIKIDRKFVTDAADDERKIAIVQAIVILARAARAKVCAEGVERAEHLDCLKRVGCDYVQGRYYHRPASGPEILDALNANRAQLEGLAG